MRSVGWADNRHFQTCSVRAAGVGEEIPPGAAGDFERNQLIVHFDVEDGQFVTGSLTEAAPQPEFQVGGGLGVQQRVESAGTGGVGEFRGRGRFEGRGIGAVNAQRRGEGRQQPDHRAHVVQAADTGVVAVADEAVADIEFHLIEADAEGRLEGSPSG